MYYDQSEFRLRFEWGLEGLQALSGDCEAVVIVDVLSFSSCADVACSRGATVFPYRWKDDRAAAFAEKNNAILAKRRLKESRRATLFHPSRYSGSPLEKKLYCLLPMDLSSAKRTFCGCLRNATSLGAFLSELSGAKLVVAACERWKITLYDLHWKIL